MTTRIRLLIARIERERRIFENRYLREARRAARLIRMNAFAAVRLGLDVAATIRASIVGDSNHRGIVPLIGEAMLVAYLLGLRRTVLETAPAPISGRPPEDEFSSARAWLIAWLGLDAPAARDLSIRFHGAAQNAVNDFADGVVNAMARAGNGGQPPILPAVAAGAFGEPRWRGPALIDLRRQLDARGISADPAHDWALAGLTSTQILHGYGQGQWMGYRQTQPALVGVAVREGGIATAPTPPQEPTAFRHISVLDERTTEICNVADGTTLAADHPYWQTHWPPLHFNCRSVAVPIFGPFDETDVPDVEPMAGFGRPW